MTNNDVPLKSPDDIKRIKDSGKILSGIFSVLKGFSMEGMSTWDIDSLIDSMILKKKARPAFKTVAGYNHSSCISINHEIVHGIPSKKKLINPGDIVKIDIGIVLKGYFSDSCITFKVGAVSRKVEKLVNTTSLALKKAIEVMIPGNRIGDIGHMIQDAAEPQGYSVVRHFTGHGVGFALHETPVIPHYGKKGSGLQLLEGMVLAIEPMINEGTSDVVILDDGWTAVTSDGKLSAQFEHTVAVTSHGPMILTE